MKIFSKELLRALTYFLIFTIVSACKKDYLTINPFEAEGTKAGYGVSDTSATLMVAVVSIECSKNKADNIKKVIYYIEYIMLSNPETELISFGESITGWYAEEPAYIQQISETIPGPFTDSLAHYAQKHSIFLSAGMAEKEEGKVYNSMVLINPNGEIIGKHRKNTLTPEDENAGYSSVRNSNVVSIKDFNVGMMICADVNGAWLTEQYIEAQIEIILSAFASPIGVPSFNLISRRMEAWQIFPNRYGSENGQTYSGLIYVSDPAGNIVAKSINNEGFVTYTIAK